MDEGSTASIVGCGSFESHFCSAWSGLLVCGLRLKIEGRLEDFRF